MILCYAFRGLKRFANFKGKNGMQKKRIQIKPTLNVEKPYFL